MDIKEKIIEKSGYDEVMHVDGDQKTEYNYIKSRIESNNRNVQRREDRRIPD